MIHPIYCDTQDAVDILDTLLDPRNDMSFQDISTQVHTYLCSKICTCTVEVKRKVT